MDYLRSIEKAINYIENNLEGNLNYNTIAKIAGISNSYFQHIFKTTCTLTIGEYIRNRRLTKAALDILMDKQSITTTAYKYGYNPDSFTKIFKKFHGCLPSKIKDISQITIFNRLNINTIIGGFMDYKIVENKVFKLLGYKKHLNCHLENRAKKVSNMWLDTRPQQYKLLNYRNPNDIRWIEVNTNISSSGLEHYITVETTEHSQDFEEVFIPAKTYAVFKTDKCSYPTEIYMELRKQIFSNWVKHNNYTIEEGLEIVIDYWFPSKDDKNKRYIEIWVPIKAKTI